MSVLCGKFKEFWKVEAEGKYKNWKNIPKEWTLKREFNKALTVDGQLIFYLIPMSRVRNTEVSLTG
jgi:hypothetical protein